MLQMNHQKKSKMRQVNLYNIQFNLNLVHLNKEITFSCFV